MTWTKKNWELKEQDKINLDSLINAFNINENIASILINRNIKTIDQANKFLNPSFSDLHSPFEMCGMYDAVDKIRIAIKNNLKIGIFADSDLDGLTSLTILFKLFTKLNLDIFYRYPKNDESYGISSEIIDEFHENDVDLMITVDSGIRDIEQIAYARELGIDVIVTDHHEQGPVLPDAIVINPKINNCNYPFKDLAGVGVTFKFCMAILYSFLPVYNKLFYIITEDDQNIIFLKYKNSIDEDIKLFDDQDKFFEELNNIEKESIFIFYKCEQLYDKFQKLDKFKSYNLFDLFLPFFTNVEFSEDITEELIASYFKINEKFFTDKIEYLKKLFLEIQYRSSDKIASFINSILGFVSIGSIADIMPLVDENRVLVQKGMENLGNTDHAGLCILMNNNEVSSKDISWGIAPLLNTPGRFGRTDLTANFFLTKDLTEVNATINIIKELNEKRKTLINELFAKFMKDFKEEKIDLCQNIAIIKSEIIPDGLAGLLANRISEEINMPTIIISLNNEKLISKGSGRCNSKFNFFSYISEFSELFIRIGGHAQAFGFTIENNKIDLLVEKISSSDPINFPDKVYNIDLEIDPGQITKEFIFELKILEPFGEGNEEPVFLSKNIYIESFSKFGAENKHGKYKLKGFPSVTAIGWNMGEQMEKYSSNDESLDMIYTLENNFYNGVNYPRMILLDVKKSNP